MQVAKGSPTVTHRPRQRCAVELRLRVCCRLNSARACTYAYLIQHSLVYVCTVVDVFCDCRSSVSSRPLLVTLGCLFIVFVGITDACQPGRCVQSACKQITGGPCGAFCVFLCFLFLKFVKFTCNFFRLAPLMMALFAFIVAPLFFLD